MGSSYADHKSFADHPSPYLQQHAEDAIHWQSFTEATINSANEQEKLIFISSGYAACYWCHRMREDTFTDQSVGKVINQNFVPILLDRELEPEVDQWLQSFMEQQRGFGGWPISLILTADAKPIVAFGYTRQQEFTDTLKRFLKDWQQDPGRIRERAEQNHLALQRENKPASTPENAELQQWLQAFLQQVSTLADTEYGGFGDQEKFPYLPQLSALLTLQQLNPDPALQQFLDTSFAAMVGGGLRDHLGGGFFRYTDDQNWTAPHYEQMLYTQALMAPLLLRFAKTFKQPLYERMARETLLAMIRYFQREDGLFQASLFATGEHGEAGGYYLWTAEQLEQVLGAGNSKKIINLSENDQRILPFVLAQGDAATDIRERLLAKRGERKLQVDDKALLGWNALVLVALAEGRKLDMRIEQAGEQLAERLLGVAVRGDYSRLLKTPSPQPLSLIGRGASTVDTSDDGVNDKSEDFSEQNTLDNGTASHPLSLRERGPGGEGEKRLSQAQISNNVPVSTPHPQPLPEATFPLKRLKQVGKEQNTSLTDQVYLAQALTAWGQAKQDNTYLKAATQLLHNIHQNYYQNAAWRYSRDNPLLGDLSRTLIPDTQLPSPSALWLELAWELGNEDNGLRTLADQVAKQLPVTQQQQAFFHATHTAALVQQRYNQVQKQRGEE